MDSPDVLGVVNAVFSMRRDGLRVFLKVVPVEVLQLTYQL